MNIFETYVEQKKLELSTKEIDSVADYFRKRFDSMTELVKLYQRKKGQIKGTAYETIAELAFQEGIEKRDGSMLTKSQVCRYLSIVRTERSGKVKAKRKAPAGLVPPVLVAPIVPVVEELKPVLISDIVKIEPAPEVVLTNIIDPKTYSFEAKHKSISGELEYYSNGLGKLIWDSSDEMLLNYYIEFSFKNSLPLDNLVSCMIGNADIEIALCFIELLTKCKKMNKDLSEFGYKVA